MTTYNEKVFEIELYAKERIKEVAEEDLEMLHNFPDMHHLLFNTDHWIVGNDKAVEWIGADAFTCIGEIQSYEEENFGQVSTDLSSPEAVANMWVYVVGDYNLCTWMEEYIEENNIQFEFDGEE